MSQRRVRQEQIAVGEAGVNNFSARLATEPLHFAADRATTSPAGTVTVVLNPGFADNKSYVVTANYDDGAAPTLPLRVTYTDGTHFTVTGDINRAFRWMAVGVSA